MTWSSYNSRLALALAAGLIVGGPIWAQERQDQDGIRGLREQDAAAARTSNQLNGGAPQSAATSAAGNTDLLLRAGIVIDARNPNRMVIERVVPNTPAFSSGLRPGDVVTRVNGSPATSLTAVAQALLSRNGGALALQVDRNGQSRQLNLTVNDNSVRTAMRPDINANVPIAGQTNPATATVGGVPLTGPGTTTPNGVTPGLGTTTAQSAGGQAIATGQPAGVGQGTATAPGQTTALGQAQQTVAGQAAATGSTINGQLPTTTANPPILPGIPSSPSALGNPTSPSLQVQPGNVTGAPTSAPGVPTAVPGVPTAVPGAPTAPGAPTSLTPSSQGAITPGVLGGSSPAANGAAAATVGTDGTGPTGTARSQGPVTPGIGGGATPPGAAGATGAGASGTSGTKGGTSGSAGVGGGTTGAAGTGGSGAGGAGTGGGTGGGAGAGGAGAGGT